MDLNINVHLFLEIGNKLQATAMERMAKINRHWAFRENWKLNYRIHQYKFSFFFDLCKILLENKVACLYYTLFHIMCMCKLSFFIFERCNIKSRFIPPWRIEVISSQNEDLVPHIGQTIFGFFMHFVQNHWAQFNEKCLKHPLNL